MIDTAITEILYQITDNVYEREVLSTDDLPALCYRGLTDNPNDTLDMTGHRESQYQISAVSNSSVEAGALAKQLRHHLRATAGSFGGVNIAQITEKQTIPDFSGDPNVHRHIIDFIIYYGE